MAGESKSHTTLTDRDYVRCLQSAIEYVASRGSIRNREIRELTGITYDQAIYFFNRAIRERHFERKGKASGTHYVKGVA